jgi:hypothetical protein
MFKRLKVLYFYILGTWSALDSLNLTRVQEFVAASNPINIMANRTFVVTSVENPPYTMLKEEVSNIILRGYRVLNYNSICVFSSFRLKKWTAMIDLRGMVLT